MEPTVFPPTEYVAEYITNTPSFLDHYAGDTYINQPRLNVVYSGSAKFTGFMVYSVVTTLVSLTLALR
jgi:hypothetical protein